MTIFFSVLSALRFFQLLALNCSWAGCLSHCLFKVETPFPNALWTLPEQRLPIFKILNFVRPTDCKNLGNRAPLLSKVNLMGIYPLHSWTSQHESLFLPFSAPQAPSLPWTAMVCFAPRLHLHPSYLLWSGLFSAFSYRVCSASLWVISGAFYADVSII